ncbi:GH92 family glycosyl hydrolase [Kibdelosporangium aridum]|uniref:Alpha-1,2-mannosidase, putative n=1 Tax=Kibdelosporangium aridum TaxID=2030 RepID=A0A1W2FTH1_KIBAR|nr:GH92 family glycosyl hydrolase [Kibdelosporangium aridum]SMD25173.1 alpha-1,2-mannosidase, putative [Kibdelosporangium aridum]
MAGRRKGIIGVLISLVSLVYVTPATAAVSLVTNPAALVNPMIGTKGDGNTFPGPSVPFGMLQWGPDSSPRHPGGGYNYDATVISGFGLNRMSGAGCFDYGDVPFLPLTGTPPADKNKATIGINHANESASTGYYSLLLNNGVKTELTAAKRSALGRFTFPAGQAATLLLKAASGAAVSDAAVTTSGTTEVTGSVGNGAFCAQGNHYQLYFAVTFDKPFTSATKWSPPPLVTGDGGIALSFPAGTVVQAKVGISFVSVANARANRDTLTGWDLAGTRQAAVTAWNTLLNRIQIGGGTVDQQKMFYTALYHALLHPNVFSDANRQYRGFDGVVRTLPAGQGDQYANFSGWDVYRTQMQLAAMVAPDVMSDFVTSMLNDYDQSGRLPKWSVANGETYVMVGDPAIPAIAAVHAFGARRFDTAKALRAMVAQASRPGNIRPGNVYLDNIGYLPDGSLYGCCYHYATTSSSLEYHVADAALAAFAKSLGDNAVHARFADRAQGWQYLLNPQSGFVQPRSANGQWRPGFSPTDFSLGDWAEGNSWKYTPMVPHNARGLINAKGGNGAMVEYLNTHFAALNDIPGEHAWMGNEPSFAVPWLYDWTGSPYLTQIVVRRIQNELFRNATDGLPGNDDLGAMSAWYVFAALGFYPAVPGTADLALGSPLFPQAVVHLPGGATLTVNAPAAASAAPYVQSMTLNGAAWDKAYLPPSVITAGGTIDLTLGTTANVAWASGPGAEPPSYGSNAIAAADNRGNSHDAATGAANYDGWGSGYSVEALANAGVVSGSRLSVDGVTYTWPNVRPGSPDNVVASGQRLTVSSPPGATKLGLLGSAEGNADGAAGTATVIYSDGTTQQATVGFSDWTLAGGLRQLRPDNAVAATMPYRNNALIGGQEQVTTYLLATSIAIDPAKTVIGLTLPSPTAGRIHVAAVGFGGHRDNVGISDDSYRGGGDFDSVGSSYSRQALAAAGLTPGASIVHAGVRYTWPATNPGDRDNMIAAGQRIAVASAGSVTKLGVLGAADGWGAQGPATINYTDGSQQSITLGFTDWTRAGGQIPVQYGNTIAAQMPYRNKGSGERENVPTYVFAATFQLQAGKTVESVTLPTEVSGGRLHIHAVGTG